MNVNIIVAMAKNQVIGKDNKMPWHLPADLAWFKKNTLNKPIIMGRKTCDSIGKALPNRTNIVLTRDKDYQKEGVICVSSVQQAIRVAKEAHTKNNNSPIKTQHAEIMVIGGSSIYTEFLPYADKLYITYIDLDTAGDTYFPPIAPAKWQEIYTESHLADEKNLLNYRYVILKKR